MNNREEYITKVLSGVKNKSAQEEIRKELECHIDDRIEYYTDSGYDLNKAESMALSKMGDAEIVGEEMDKIHKPINKKPIKIAVIIVVSLLILRAISLPVWSSYTLYGKYFMNKYDALNEINLDDIGNYEKYKYQTHINNMAVVFKSYASVLTAEYSQDEYNNQLEEINEKYIFLDSPMYSECDGVIDYYIPENEFDIGDWHIRVIAYQYDEDESYIQCPYYIEMIGQNDNECKIAYFEFSDSELDFISENQTEGEMEKFIDEYFDYNFK
jgi:hypothetical protein